MTMLDDLQEKISTFFDGIQQKADAAAAGIQSAQDGMNELLDIFISLKSFVVSVFSFLGRETSILLLCTALVLFVLNLVPFLFIGKKFRYCAGMAAGVYLGWYFSYSFAGILKYVLIMLLPLAIERLFVFCFGKSASLAKRLVKRSLLLVWRAGCGGFEKVSCKIRKRKPADAKSKDVDAKQKAADSKNDSRESKSPSASDSAEKA